MCCQIAAQIQKEIKKIPNSNVLQRSINPVSSYSISTIHGVLNSSGQPLDSGTRAYMEPRFGHDFSKIRIHADAKAAESARAINALAYTLGQDVVFGQGQYAPGTSEGRMLLGHELTHVVQQTKLVDNKVQRVCGPQNIPPASDCTSSSTNVPVSLLTSRPFLFTKNCDDFRAGEEAALIQFVRDTANSSSDRIEIRGFASIDGPLDFNINLACARAKKARTVLTGENLYPPSSPPPINHGPVAGNAEQQRSVIVVVRPTAPPPTPTPRIPNPPSPPLPAPSLSSCTSAQITMVNSHVSVARTWVNDAVPKIRAVADGTASPVVSAIVNAALAANFHTVAPTDVQTIAANFENLRTELMTALDIECVSAFWCKPGDLAYVRGAFAFIRRLQDVNLCPLWFSCSNYYKRVSTIIHEVAHQHPGADDNAYEHQAAYATLNSADAIDNAASYEVAARQIYYSGSHGPGETC